MKNRQKNLLKHANKSGYNAIVALDPENLFYMTGFWGEAIGVLDSSGAKIIAPALEASRAKADSSDCKVFSSDRGSSMITDLVSLLRGKKPCTELYKLPHAQVTNRKFKTGDLIVADLTLRYKGYVSDATRTFAVGKISAKAQKAYEDSHMNHKGSD